MFVVRKPQQSYDQTTVQELDGVRSSKGHGVLVEREVMMDYSRSLASESPLDQKL